MTNADYIRSLSDELLHATLSGLMGLNETETDKMKDWLLQDFKVDDWR